MKKSKRKIKKHGSSKKQVEEAINKAFEESELGLITTEFVQKVVESSGFKPSKKSILETLRKQAKKNKVLEMKTGNTTFFSQTDSRAGNLFSAMIYNTKNGMMSYEISLEPEFKGIDMIAVNEKKGKKKPRLIKVNAKSKRATHLYTVNNKGKVTKVEKVKQK